MHPDGSRISSEHQHKPSGNLFHEPKGSATSQAHRPSRRCCPAQRPVKQPEVSYLSVAVNQDHSSQAGLEQPRRRRRGVSKPIAVSQDCSSESSCGECHPPRRRRKPVKQSKVLQQDDDAENRQPDIGQGQIEAETRHVLPHFQCM